MTVSGVASTTPAGSATADPDRVDLAVAIKGLNKRYGSVEAVSDLNLDVAKGELIAVLGASGSGKTTLLRMIAGFESVSEGRIELFGRDVSRLSPADREIGMVFQNYALMPHLNVRRNVEYGLRMRGWSRADRKARVDEMLPLMRLDHLGERLPRQLSGGQQQRVAIARALAYSPKLLLMDEPMGALDKALKHELLAEIRRVHRKFSTTILYVTHDREEALSLADRVALMADSRLVDCAPVEEMYLRPKSRFAAEFFATANVLPVTAHTSGGRATTTTVELAGVTREVAGTPTGDRTAIAVRPRDVLLADPATACDGWALDGIVEEAIFLGDDVRVTVRISVGQTSDGGADEGSCLVTCLVPLSARERIVPGGPVTVTIDPGRAHLLDYDGGVRS
jgi:putative spermidine/putrescine transport system ATP-binding protein